LTRDHLAFSSRWKIAAAVLLAVGLSVAGYRLGVGHDQNDAARAQRPAISEAEALRAQLTDMAKQRESLDDQLVARDHSIVELTEQTKKEASEVARLSELERASDYAVKQSEQDGMKRASDLEAQRDDLSRRLQDSQASLASIREQLDSLQRQRDTDLSREASLESRIAELSAQVQNGGETERDRQLLAADTDIRELMGARDLYIADVYDVDDDGQTQKPFGRVFYTRQKSLIFYAFDLDQSPGLHNASASSFQVWGRRQATRDRPLNMGVFYQDNSSNKRWVLKFENPQALAQIDAVYVTVEPKGGSDKPRGKQLLFAYLRRQPNHP
jgi:hypothetical protein